MYTHSPKKSLRNAIHDMLESYGYVIHVRNIKKFNRMNRKMLNEMYNLIRYHTNKTHVENDIYLIFGIVLIDD
jgi:hypothetical protein